MKTPPQTSVDNKNVLADAIYEQLKEKVMELVFEPGSRLNIDALAAELNVSPTPVREALARLAAERLVTFEPFKGYSVNQPLTPRQVADLMHVRRLIEVDAVRLAAHRILVPELMMLEKLLSAGSNIKTGTWSAGYKSFNQIDQAFHIALISAADNSFLLETYRSLNIHIQLARFHPFFDNNDQDDTVDEHASIYQAISQHDPDAAARAIEAHLHKTELRIFRLQDSNHSFSLKPAKKQQEDPSER
jgi:DNA-binding GntR family transcriptional regulator